MTRMCAAAQAGRGFAQLDETLQLLIDAPFRSLGIVAPRHLFPIRGGPVNPAAVVRLGRVAPIAVIIERTDFVAQIDERNAADAER